MSARDLFEQIIQDGWAGVQAWKATEAEESLQLEFKRQQDGVSGVFGDSDKGQLAKAMSGFANVEGGVLVFGVHAREMGKNPDRVQSICEIPDVAKFQAMVDKSVPRLTDPPIAGIEVRRIEHPSRPGHGVVVVFVPQSLGGPHQAVNATAEVNEHYYMRTASQTVRMPHAILASMFGRRPPSRLELSAEYVIGSGTCNLKFKVVNRGKVFAERVGLTVDPTASHFAWGDLQRGEGFKRLIQSDGAKRIYILQSEADTVIYPGMEVTVGYFNPSISVSPSAVQDLKIHLVGSLHPPDGPSVPFRIGTTIAAAVILGGAQGVLPLFWP